jgi:hypothetical protein
MSLAWRSQALEGSLLAAAALSGLVMGRKDTWSPGSVTREGIRNSLK